MCKVHIKWESHKIWKKNILLVFYIALCPCIWSLEKFMWSKFGVKHPKCVVNVWLKADSLPYTLCVMQAVVLFWNLVLGKIELKFVKYNMSTFVFKNFHQRFDKYAVAHTEHDALVKNTMKIFSNFVAFSENPNFNYV